MSRTHTISYSWDGKPIDPSDEVHVALQQQPSGLSIEINAPYYADSAPESPPGTMWELWNHEVVEIFLVGENGEYLEAEFGPHGHHLLLWLDAPRNIVRKHLPVQYTASIQDKRWYGSIHIDSTELPPAILRWNLFSIHGQGAHRKYQCMFPLDTPKPDFHQPQRFPFFPESL